MKLLTRHRLAGMELTPSEAAVLIKWFAETGEEVDIINSRTRLAEKPKKEVMSLEEIIVEELHEEVSAAAKPFFDMSKLPKENILDLYGKTVVTKINERLVMLQVREDKIIISPVGDEHRLNIDFVLDGRTLKITSELTPTLTLTADRTKNPVQDGDTFYHALRDKTYVYMDGVLKFVHDGRPA